MSILSFLTGTGDRVLEQKLRERLEKANQLASKLGDIVGRVSRFAPSLLAEEGSTVVFEVEPSTYVTSPASLFMAGSYLAVVNARTLHVVSLRVRKVERRDVLAELSTPITLGRAPPQDAAGLITPVRVEAEPLLAMDPTSKRVEAANEPIEPQSPVVRIRNPELVAKLLGLPVEKDSIPLGALAVGGKTTEPLIPLKLPVKVLYQHVLVLGTTGSGKTTLLKNMIAALTTEKLASALIIDINRDYLQLPFKPRSDPSTWDEPEKSIASKIYANVNPPPGTIALVPVTKYMVEELVGDERDSVEAMKKLAKSYVEEVYAPLAARILGKRMNVVEVKPLSYPGVAALALVRAVIGDYEFNVGVAPYAFRFSSIRAEELTQVLFRLTALARDFIVRAYRRLLNENLLGDVDTLSLFTESLDLAQKIYFQKLKKARSDDERRKAYAEAVSYGAATAKLLEFLDEAKPHPGTVENAVRVLRSVVDSGVFDVDLGRDKLAQQNPAYLLSLASGDEKLRGYPLVLDLDILYHSGWTGVSPRDLACTMVYDALNKLLSWKMKAHREARETPPAIVFIDEAHRFFPSRETGAESDVVSYVAGLIDRVARLGRARRLGLVFATHSPRDLHPIILQLTNTKIVLRMDKAHLEKLDLPREYRDLVVKADDRVAVVKTHVIRTGYAVIKTTYPLVGHYDLSAM